MKPDPRQVLAPNWLIVTHLLGAAVMLYFVSHPSAMVPSELDVKNPIINAPVPENPIINVAELRAPMVLGNNRLEIPD